MKATRAARALDQFLARETAAIGTQWSGAKECNEPMVIAPSAKDTKRLVVLMVVPLGRTLNRLWASRLEPLQPGVDAFARIWRALPGFRHGAFLFRVPVIRQLTMLAYKLFLKWQSWHRKHRR